MKPRQLSLIPKPSKEHGGTTRLGKRKIARPLTTKKPLHVIFRATKARGLLSFMHRKNKADIHILLLDTAKRFGIRIDRYENVGNHIHLVMQGKKRAQIQAFLRVFPQRVMFHVTGACKGNPQGRFFDYIAYSRVVEWGREFKIVTTYLLKNALEALSLSRLYLKPLPS
jgi:REP element-mobilizing transposase RayT